MDDKYIKQCFRMVNKALKANNCLELAPYNAGEVPFIEFLLRFEEIGKSKQAEFQARFPVHLFMPLVHGTRMAIFTLRFDEYGSVLEDSIVTAMEGGFIKYKEGLVKRNSLGWFIEWEP